MAQTWCEGELTGNPDIAGKGVVASIITTSVLGIALSFSVFVLEESEERPRPSKLHHALSKSAMLLADTQLVTSLAIILSSIILIHTDGETSLYHVFIARCLVHINLAGYAIATGLNAHRQQNKSIRVALLVLTLIFYTYWTSISITEFQSWNPDGFTRTPACFYSHSLVPLWYTTEMYLELAWLLLTWLCVSIEATGWFAERLSELEPRMETGIASLLPTTPLPFDSFSLADIPRILLKVPVAIARSLFFVTIHPLSTSVWMMVFFVWAVYELVAARSANRHLLVAFPAGSTGNVGSHTGGNANPEDDWGFGQLMPLFLLILPVLQIVDVLSEASVVESAQVKSQSQAHPHQGQVQVDSRSRGARSSQVSAHQAVLRRTRSGLVPGAGFAGS